MGSLKKFFFGENQNKKRSTEVLSCTPSLEVVPNEVVWEIFWKVFRRSCGPPTRSVGPTDRSAGLLVGRTHLSGTAVSLVGGDPRVPMSHRPLQSNKAKLLLILVENISKSSSSTKQVSTIISTGEGTQPPKHSSKTFHFSSRVQDECKRVKQRCVSLVLTILVYHRLNNRSDVNIISIIL
jgi:hypothetical protein